MCKDSLSLRVCKNIVGQLICRDLYSHIRSEHVVESIIKNAHLASDAKSVQALIKTIQNLEYKVFRYDGCCIPKHRWDDRKVIERILKANRGKEPPTKQEQAPKPIVIIAPVAI